MRPPLSKTENLGDKIVNAVLFAFGRCRVKLSEWPDLQAGSRGKIVIAAIKQRGGVLVGEGGMPTATDEYYFRMPEGRVTLSFIDYGPAYLTGPKRLVRELATQSTA